MTRESILIVDDEPGVRSTLEAILKDEGYSVEAAATGEDGVARAAGRSFDAVLLDVWLPGIDGIETLSRVRAAGGDAEVVMISGHGTIETAVKATKLGAFDFVEKPLSLEKTLLVVRNALQKRRLEKRNRSLLDQLTRDTEILGESEPARRARHEAGVAADSDVPVLICGESGTGRETIARYVHATSRRADQAFVEVPCAALAGDAGLLERLTLAERGSIVFQDVDALAPALQARVAALLPAHPDVRLMATAAADPAGLKSPLREQFDVVRIATAPLRERRDDIAGLAARFLRELAREYGRPDKRFTPEATRALARHEWPGNVRALRNVVERALLLAAGDEIQVSDLPSELGGASSPSPDLYAPFPTLADGLAAFTRYFVRRALRESKGDFEEAARRLSIPTSELRGRIG